MTVCHDHRWRISYTEIAALAEVKRPVATTWARRHADFPRPMAHEGGRPYFDGREVVTWLLDTGRGKAPRQRLQAELALHTLSGWRDRLPAPVLVNALTALICLRQQQDGPLAGLDWPSLLRQATLFDPDDTFLLAELRAVPGGPGIGPALAALADDLVEAARSRAEAFEAVLDARRRLGAHELAADEPAPLLTEALVRLSGISGCEEGGVVATPYARSGDLLAAAHAQAAPDAAHTYLAADPDPAFARLIRRRMLVREIFEFQLDVAVGDEPAYDDWDYPDVLLCALPYEPAETRSAVGVLEQVERLTDTLRTGRSAVVLGPADALVGPLPPLSEADRLRRSFLAQDLLKAAISLPDGAYPYRPGYRTAVWVLARTPEAQRRGVILLVDLSGRPLDKRTLDALVEDVDIFRAAGWRADPRHAPRHGVIIPAKVLDNRPGTAFTPQHRPYESRYTREVIERPERISRLEIRLRDLAGQARQDLEERPELRAHAVLRSADQSVRWTTIRRMLEERRLCRLPGHRIEADHVTPEGDYPVLTPEEVLGTAPAGGRRIDRLVLLREYGHAGFTRPGDVIVTMSPEFGAYVDEEGLCVVAYPACVLRPRPEADRPVRPRVLAALLRAAAAGHRRTGGSVRAPRRLEDLIIPDLPPDEADRYDALLAMIGRRSALLRAQAAVLDDLSRLVAAGIADGTLTLLPPPDAD